LEGHTGGVKQVLFLDNEGRTLISCGEDKTIRQWDTVSGKETNKVGDTRMKCSECTLKITLHL
jgi:WD40 repeat protein